MSACWISLPANSQTANEFVAQGLSLGNSTQATGSNLLSIELNSSLLEAKSFLDNRCQLANATALLTQNILGTCSQNDDFCASGGKAHLIGK